MLRRTLTRLAVAGTVVAGTVAGVASPAWAPKYIFGTFAFGSCVIDGETSRLNGDLTVESFSNVGGTLYVNGSLTGTCFDGVDPVASITPALYSFPVVDFTAACDAEFAGVDIRPGTGQVDAVDFAKHAFKMTLDLYPSTIVERTWMPGEPMSVRGRLCALSRMAAQRDPANLAGALNQLVLRV